MIKTLYTSFLIALFLFLNISAQKDFSKPVKIDEFGDIALSDLKARADQAAIAHQNNPNTKIFVIGYRTRYEPPGKIIRRLKATKRYLTYNRGVDPQRVITVDGEQTNCSLTQLWIVPDGQTPEIQKFYSNDFENTESVRKFDEIYYAFDDLEYESEEDSMEEFAAAVKKEIGAAAYVILYPEYSKHEWSNIVNLDSPGKTAKIQAEIRNTLIKKYGVSPAKIKVINGGYRDFRQVELWILPRGKRPPIATPNAFPPRKRK